MSLESPQLRIRCIISLAIRNDDLLRVASHRNVGIVCDNHDLPISPNILKEGTKR